MVVIKWEWCHPVPSSTLTSTCQKIMAKMKLDKRIWTHSWTTIAVWLALNNSHASHTTCTTWLVVGCNKNLLPCSSNRSYSQISSQPCRPCLWCAPTPPAVTKCSRWWLKLKLSMWGDLTRLLGPCFYKIIRPTRLSAPAVKTHIQTFSGQVARH